MKYQTRLRFMAAWFLTQFFGVARVNADPKNILLSYLILQATTSLRWSKRRPQPEISRTRILRLMQLLWRHRQNRRSQQQLQLQKRSMPIVRDPFLISFLNCLVEIILSFIFPQYMNWNSCGAQSNRTIVLSSHLLLFRVSKPFMAANQIDFDSPSPCVNTRNVINKSSLW